MLKVLFMARPDLFKIKAGDTTQIIQLKGALEKKGIKVILNTQVKPDRVTLSNVDLVHGFNLLRVEVSMIQCQWVKEIGKPLIFTPIYWNMEEYLRNLRPDHIDWWYKGQEKRKKMLKLVDLLAPNGIGEWLQLKRDFGLDLPYKIIYNGVDPVFFSRKKGERKIVLSVGRIHSRKNQLTVIKALKGTGLPTVFVGDINDPAYYRQCLKEAGTEDFKFVPGVNQRNLINYYQKARVHVLASWYDTPGLVNLEAGLAGCNLVVTNRGTTKEYFKDQVEYCNPLSLTDIREKVLESYKNPKASNLADHILKNFTWDIIADRTVDIYNEFLSSFI